MRMKLTPLTALPETADRELLKYARRAADASACLQDAIASWRERDLAAVVASLNEAEEIEREYECGTTATSTLRAKLLEVEEEEDGGAAVTTAELIAKYRHEGNVTAEQVAEIESRHEWCAVDTAAGDAGPAEPLGAAVKRAHGTRWHHVYHVDCLAHSEYRGYYLPASPRRHSHTCVCEGVEYAVQVAALVAEVRIYGWSVRDTSTGRRWWPYGGADEEIKAAADPAAKALEICQRSPMRGVWRD